jgi:hypothetical protein
MLSEGVTAAAGGEEGRDKWEALAAPSTVPMLAPLVVTIAPLAAEGEEGEEGTERWTLLGAEGEERKDALVGLVAEGTNKDDSSSISSSSKGDT